MRYSKILLVSLEYPPDCGGVARYYGEIVKHGSDTRQGVRSDTRQGVNRSDTRQGVKQQGEISVLKPRFWRLWPRWLPFIWQISRLIRKEKIEMLWVGQVLPIGYAAWWLKKRKKIPYAVFTHGMDILVPQRSWWKKRWLKKILANADLVVANSEFTRNEVVKLGVPSEKMLVLYPCPGLKSELRIPNSELELNDKKVILSVGRLVKRKGFDQVIKVLPRVLKRIPEARYIIVGNGPERENLKSKIKNLKLEERVSILENVDDAELANWYNQCRVFVLPCRQIDGDVEGFGMVFLEAASFGKPVVVGRSGGAPETTRHGYGGFVVDPESLEELYQALVRLLTDEAFARQMGEYGRNWVTKHFQWEREVEKLLAIYRDTRHKIVV